jgi:Ran-binding protein 3
LKPDLYADYRLIYVAHTGEEDEDTVYQVRCKLHIMDESGAWRERGTGSLRVNIDKKRSGSAPRLGRHAVDCKSWQRIRLTYHLVLAVMRAEGVLRLILNVSMFPNMSFDVTDKYVRTVVFEDGQSRSILIRVSE